MDSASRLAGYWGDGEVSRRDLSQREGGAVAAAGGSGGFARDRHARPAEPVGLRERGIDESQAADLRHRLARFAEDWDRPEMGAYDELPPR